VLYTIEKIFSRAIKYSHHTFKKKIFEKNISVKSFVTIKVPVLGLPLGVPGKSDI